MVARATPSDGKPKARGIMLNNRKGTSAMESQS